MKIGSKKAKKVKKIFSIILGLFLLIATFINTFLLIKYKVTIKYILIYGGLFILIPLLLVYFTVFRRPKKTIKRILNIIEIIFLILVVIVFIYLNKTFNFLDKVTSKYGYETKNYYVLVPIDSRYNNISDLENKTIGYAKNFDVSINKAINKLEDKVVLNETEIDSYTDLFSDLDNDDIAGILIIESIYNMLSEDDEELKNNYKVLYEFSIKEKINNIGEDVDVTEDAFNVYISGMDSYSKITDKSRSDVNIIVSVNPKTHKILMINIPRDYYVALDGINEMDKLTHAGIYGVETSVRTIENLLDIKINYYVKVNYNALIGIVNALDGVEVYSEYNFYSSEFNYKFVKGYNKVNGKMALDFCRTRYAFLDGDRVRGENQQRMIEAIINKANSPKVLLKYNDILSSLEGSFTTNLSTDKIMSLVNMQLDGMPSWEINKFSLNGTDGSEITYSFPSQELYVMYPNDETITEAKNMIKTLREEK